jgi:hypothetical protein
LHADEVGAQESEAELEPRIEENIAARARIIADVPQTDSSHFEGTSSIPVADASLRETTWPIGK